MPSEHTFTQARMMVPYVQIIRAPAKIILGSKDDLAPDPARMIWLQTPLATALGPRIWGPDFGRKCGAHFGRPNLWVSHLAK